MGCCLYKQSTIKSQVATNLSEVPCCRVAFQTLRGNLDKCLYGCGGLQSIIFLNPKTTLSIRIYELLFERGFVRNAEYFRKYDTNQCCCVGYNSRVIAEDNTPTSKQNQIILHFTQVIEQLWNGSFQDGAKKQNILKEQNFTKKNKDNKHPNFLIDYSQEVQQILNEIKAYLLECQIMEVNLQILESTSIKVFQNNGGYYTNHNLLLYHKNQTQLKRMNIQQKQFNILLGQHLNGKSILQKKYFLDLKKNGYLNIVNPNSEKQVKPEKQNIKLAKEIKIIPQNLIDQQTFTFEEFYVGKMKINLKNPQSTDEIVQLYLDYMAGVHFDVSDMESFIKYYTPNVLEKNEVLVDQQSKKKLQLGQRFMEYRINNMLIGVGVIVLTTQHLISEYLFYKPNLKKESFGIFAAFVEINYVKQIQKVFPSFQYQSMSYIISTNKSMSYKMQFSGLEIQCCNTYEWVKYNKQIKEKMKANQPQLSDKLVLQVNYVDANNCMFFYKGKNIKYNQLNDEQKQDVTRKMKSVNQVLWPELLKELIFEIEEQV